MANEPKKFFRQVFEIEVLSEDQPLPSNISLDDINYEITDGHCSGVYKQTVCEEVSREKMCELLTAQGSDPSFLLGDEDDEEDA